MSYRYPPPYTRQDTSSSSGSWDYIVLFIFIFAIIVIVLIVLNTGNTPPANQGIAPLAPPLAGLTAPNRPPTPPFGPIPPNSITDCAKYGNSSTPASCRSGTAEWNGSCYEDLWTSRGGVKTAYETVNYGPYGGVYTKCGIGIYYLDYGAPCTMVGPDYYKTAVCTCQLRGDITSSTYAQYTGMPTECPAGTDSFNSKCYSAPCPSGYRRTRDCTCSPV